MVSHEVVRLIEVTTTRAGMTVNTKLEKKQYRTSVTVSAKEMISVNLEAHMFRKKTELPHQTNQLYCKLIDGSARQGSPLSLLLRPSPILTSD